MAKSNKPRNPYPTFPLTAHPNGQRCKTIRYKLHDFGPRSDPDGALKQYQAVAANLHAGRQPRLSVPAGGLTIKDMANAYLESQHEKARAGAISKRWWNDQRGSRWSRCFAIVRGAGRARMRWVIRVHGLPRR